jgi:hypothetical protein
VVTVTVSRCEARGGGDDTTVLQYCNKKYEVNIKTRTTTTSKQVVQQHKERGREDSKGKRFKCC